MDADLARFLRDELGHAPDASAGAGPWLVRGPVWLWQGSDGAPAKGSWYFLPVPERLSPPVTHGWGRTPVTATVGGQTWETYAQTATGALLL